MRAEATLETGPQSPTADPAPGPVRRRRTALVVVMALVLAWGGVATARAWRDRDIPAEVSTSTVVTRAQLAARYGVDITLVGVTAAGGLLDLRFTVTDAARAERLFNDEHAMPALFAEPTGVLIEAPSGMRHTEVTPVDGGKYFVLYANPGGVVQTGVPVSVVINGVRVEHIVAQS